MWGLGGGRERVACTDLVGSPLRPCALKSVGACAVVWCPRLKHESLACPALEPNSLRRGGAGALAHEWQWVGC